MEAKRGAQPMEKKTKSQRAGGGGLLKGQLVLCSVEIGLGKV